MDRILWILILLMGLYSFQRGIKVVKKKTAMPTLEGISPKNTVIGKSATKFGILYIILGITVFLISAWGLLSRATFY